MLGLTRDAGKGQSLAEDEIEPVIGSLQDPSEWRAAAASAGVLAHAAVDYSADTMALDEATVETLIGIASARDATLIYTSGAWVHGDTAGRVADETAPLAPIEIVARRPNIEQRVRGASRIRGIVIRPGIVYGRKGGLTASLFEDRPLVGDGSNHWPLVHVDDLADAYVRVAEGGSSGAVYVIVDRSRATVRELANAARAAAGLSQEPRWLPHAQARMSMGAFADALVLDQQLSAARAERELGWRPVHAEFVAEAPVYAAANRRSVQ